MFHTVTMDSEADFCEELQRDCLLIRGGYIRMGRIDEHTSHGPSMGLAFSYMTPLYLVEFFYILRPGAAGILTRADATANLDALAGRVTTDAVKHGLAVRPGRIELAGN